MKLTKSAEQPTVRGDGRSFNRAAWRQTLAVGDGPTPLHVARVTFEPGARTVWHAYPRGQVLIATAGVGRYQTGGDPVPALVPGDSVTVAWGERRWHGAASDSLFVHTSIQAEGDGGEQADGMEPVGAEDYARQPEQTS